MRNMITGECTTRSGPLLVLDKVLSRAQMMSFLLRIGMLTKI